MKKTLLSFLLFLALVTGNAFNPPVTLSDGSEAPNFTLTDINGVSHTLYDYLDQGKMVIVEFSAVWCGICWNYHNQEVMKDLYQAYGPNGTDDLVVLFVEGDNSTAESLLFGGPGSVGDWTDGTPYPMMDDGTGDVAADFMVFSFPKLYAICPDRKTYSVGTASYSTWENWIQSCSLTGSETVSDIDCFGQDNGSINLNVSGGFGNITYEWNTGATTQNLDNLSAGTYSCTITEGNGHTVVLDDLMVDSPEELTIELDDLQDVSCAGDGNGSIAVSGNGGVADYNFSWNNGQSGPNAINLNGGNFIVTITDANNCTMVSNYDVNEPNPIVLDVTATDESGNGTMDGSITVVVDGGTPNYTYTWSNGDSGPILENLAPGQYDLTVTDDNGCEETASITIQSFDCSDFEADISSSPASCEITANGSASVNIISGVANEYNWSNGANTQQVEELEPGTYQVTVTDENNCELVLEVEVTVTPDMVNPSISCPDNITTIECGNPVDFDLPIATDDCGVDTLFQTFGMESGMVFPEGTTTVGFTAIDFSGNASSCMFEVTVENTLVLDELTTINTCIGEALGIATTTAITGGSIPYTIDWSNGTQGTFTEGLAAGMHSLTITDGGGCIIEETFEIEAQPAPTIELVEVIDATNGQNNGSIEINITGGVPPLSTLWFDETGNLFATGEDLIDIPPGTYMLEVSDDLGCLYTLASGPVVVENISGVNDILFLSNFEVVPNPSTGLFNVNWTLADQKDLNLQILDWSGRQVFQQHFEQSTAQTATIDLQTYASGVYVVRLQIGNQSAIRKIVVE